MGTIQPPLSRHPWGIGKWLLNRGWPLNRYLIPHSFLQFFWDFGYWPLNGRLTVLEKAKCNLMAFQLLRFLVRAKNKIINDDLGIYNVCYFYVFVVQLHPCLKFNFHWFQTHYCHTAPYPQTKEIKF